MIRAQKQCRTCPFRDMPEDERREMATIPPEDWPCHTEQGYAATCDIQCRGHWEARRKYAA
jgi:hypothetical protein